MRIEIEFLEKIDITDKIREAVNKGLYEVGIGYKSVVVPMTPKDSGDLRASYNITVKDGELTVSNSMKYAAYVEFGDLLGKHARGDGRIPFMRPALYDFIDRWIKHLIKAINEVK